MKKPYLIQRCSLSGKPFSMDLRTGQYWSMDYMGSSEFEFGVIPKFQRDIHAKIDKMVTIEVELKGPQGKTAKVWALVDKGDEAEYAKVLQQIVDRDIQMKESTYIHQALNLLADHEIGRWKSDITFWMDLTNNFVFASTKEQITLFKTTVKNSVVYMDSQKAG